MRMVPGPINTEIESRGGGAARSRQPRNRRNRRNRRKKKEERRRRGESSEVSDETQTPPARQAAEVCMCRGEGGGMEGGTA